VSARELGERATGLGARVIAPLVLGGTLCPVRPIGIDMALEIGRERRIEDDELRMAVDGARLRRARAVCAVDALPELSAAQWTIAAALNDLLQVTNDELSGFATRSRHAALLGTTRQLCEAIAPSADLEEAIARHATFGRVLELVRTDQRLSWWTGSALFRGRTPPTRLGRWPRLRRVDVQQDRVPLVSMADWAPVDAGEYLATLTALLACSPLSDLATVDRKAPAFVWAPSSLALVSTHAGCNLALRAFATREPSATVWSRKVRELGAAALAALERASNGLPDAGAGRHIALGFTQVFREATAAWSAEAA
jgi:hypothetical protein